MYINYVFSFYPYLSVDLKNSSKNHYSWYRHNNYSNNCNAMARVYTSDKKKSGKSKGKNVRTRTNVEASEQGQE